MADLDRHDERERQVAKLRQSREALPEATARAAAEPPRSSGRAPTKREGARRAAAEQRRAVGSKCREEEGRRLRMFAAEAEAYREARARSFGASRGT